MARKQNKLVSHWIVVNWEANSIWQKPYMDKQDAENALVDISAKRPNEKWVLEERKSWMDISDSEITQKDFDTF